jgi:FkbM family methyltransferase
MLNNQILRELNYLRFKVTREIASLMVPKGPILINNSFSMYTDHYDASGLALNRTYEPEQTALIKKNVKKESIALDIGANIGYYSLLFATICKKVYAFEPERENYELLKRNIDLNHFGDRITTERKALSDHEGKLTLNLDRYNFGGHSIIAPRHLEGTETVSGVRLDDYFKNKEKPDYIKIDVEGYEKTVIRGGKQIFRNAKLILFEDNSREAALELKAMGFSVHVLSQGNNFYAVKKQG